MIVAWSDFAWAWVGWVAGVAVSFAAIEGAALIHDPDHRFTLTRYIQGLTDARNRGWRWAISIAAFTGLVAWSAAHLWG